MYFVYKCQTLFFFSIPQAFIIDAADSLNSYFSDGMLDVEDIDTHIFESSPSSQSSLATTCDSIDSDVDLPDDDHPVDLIKYLDSPDIDAGLNIKCEGDCNMCDTPNKYIKYRVSARQDPFMGMGAIQPQPSSICGTPSSEPTNILLGPNMNPLDFDFDQSFQQQQLQQQRFCAWGHIPKTDDSLDLLNKSSVYPNFLGLFEEEAEEVIFPETPSPSSHSSTITGTCSFSLF